MSVSKTSNMREVEQSIKEKRMGFLGKGEEGQESICIVKRHQNDEYLYHEIINLQDYYGKSIDAVGIFEGEILFV